MTYMPNSVVDFAQIDEDGLVYEFNGVKYTVEDYTSFDFKKMHDFLHELPEDLFTWIQVNEDDKIEKISYDLYGTSRYWDILILLNKRDPLFDMSYKFDTLSLSLDIQLDNYNDNIRELTPERRSALEEHYISNQIIRNDDLKFLRVVYREKIGEFLRLGYDKGFFR